MDEGFEVDEYDVFVDVAAKIGCLSRHIDARLGSQGQAHRCVCSRRHSNPVTRNDHTAAHEHLYARLPGHLEASERETMDRRDSCHDRKSAAVHLYALSAMMRSHLSSRDRQVMARAVTYVRRPRGGAGGRSTRRGGTSGSNLVRTSVATARKTHRHTPCGRAAERYMTPSNPSA